MADPQREGAPARETPQPTCTAREWVASPEGRKAAQEALREAAAFTSELRRAREVDPQWLDKPVTQISM